MRPLLAVPALLLAAPAPAPAQGFPQTFEHRFGTTVVEAAPERVVSLDYGGQDDLLALGIVPVAVRYWYGDYPLGTWPWAQEALGDATFEMLEGDLNVEQVAALDPDLILAQYSGLTAEEYALLSQVAPVVAAEARYDDYSTPWDVRIRNTARAVGKGEEAEAQLEAIEDRLAEAAAAHPEWQGLTAAVVSYWNGAPSAYTSEDPRSKILGELGFATPPAIDEAAADGTFYVALSNEDVAPFDADVVVWLDDAGAILGAIDMPLRRTMRAHREGREAYADDVLTGAFSFASLLSMPYVLDHLVPQIEAAADGDPATPVPEAVAVGLAE